MCWCGARRRQPRRGGQSGRPAPSRRPTRCAQAKTLPRWWEYSDAPEGRRDGGLLGLRPTDRYPELFVTSTQNLPVGGVVGPVRSPAGFHILKVVERSAAGSGPTVADQRPPHPAAHRPQLSEAAAAERLNEYRRRIQAGQADFATLAREHSQDGSAKQAVTWAGPTPAATCPSLNRP